jgi:hypothetical protein
MTSPRPPASSPPPDGDDPRARTVGAVLVGAAVLIGLLLLWRGFAQEGGVVETATPRGETTTTSAAPVPLGEPTTTTTTAPVGNPPASVPVLVANGTGKAGVAGTNADRLKGAGYTNVDTANADSTATSVVYFTPGAQPDAIAVGQVLGITAIQPLPSSPPVPLDGATVLVVIGSDKA